MTRNNYPGYVVETVTQLNRIATVICYVLLSFVVLVSVLQVILRYGFDRPTSWSEEISLVCIVWFGMISLSVGIWRHEHIAIGYFNEHLPQPVSCGVSYVTQALIVMVMIVILVGGWQLVAFVGTQPLPASRIPKSFLYASTVAGGALGAINGIANIVFRRMPRSIDR